MRKNRKGAADVGRACDKSKGEGIVTNFAELAKLGYENDI